MKKKLNSSEKKVLIIWAIIAVILMIIISLIQIDMKNKNIQNNKYTIVNNVNRYYTVKGALDKYYLFLANKDAESVLKILDKDYVSENGLNKDNISKLYNNEELEFLSKLMCEKKIKNNINSYIVTGYEHKKSEHDSIVKNDKDYKKSTKYYQVILDEKNLTFSVAEISKDFFEGECNFE